MSNQTTVGFIGSGNIGGTLARFADRYLPARAARPCPLDRAAPGGQQVLTAASADAGDPSEAR